MMHTFRIIKKSHWLFVRMLCAKLSQLYGQCSFISAYLMSSELQKPINTLQIILNAAVVLRNKTDMQLKQFQTPKQRPELILQAGMLTVIKGGGVLSDSFITGRLRRRLKEVFPEFPVSLWAQKQVFIIEDHLGNDATGAVAVVRNERSHLWKPRDENKEIKTSAKLEVIQIQEARSGSSFLLIPLTRRVRRSGRADKTRFPESPSFLVPLRKCESRT